MFFRKDNMLTKPPLSIKGTPQLNSATTGTNASPSALNETRRHNPAWLQPAYHSPRSMCSRAKDLPAIHLQ